MSCYANIATPLALQSERVGLIKNYHFSYHLVLRMRSENVNKKLSSFPLTFDPAKMSTRRAISFAGGGFMTIYHVGVLEAIAEEGARKQKLTKKKKRRRGNKTMIKSRSHDHFAGSILSRLGMLYGASGGAFIAVNIACGMSPKIAMEFIVDLHERAASFGCCWGRFGTFHPKFQLVRRTREFLEKYLPPDAHKKCSGRVGVSLTEFPSMENKIITEFNTRAELIQVMITIIIINNSNNNSNNNDNKKLLIVVAGFNMHWICTVILWL